MLVVEGVLSEEPQETVALLEVVPRDRLAGVGVGGIGQVVEDGLVNTGRSGLELSNSQKPYNASSSALVRVSSTLGCGVCGSAKP